MRLPLHCLLLAAACLSAGTPATAAEPVTTFNTTAPTDDLKGNLPAQVLFAQSQVIPGRPREGDRQPHLIGSRKTLLMVRLVAPNGTGPLMVTAKGKDGKEWGTLTMNPPNLLPKTAYHLDGVPEKGLDFAPADKTVSTVKGGTEIGKLSDPSGAALRERLRTASLVEIRTADGQWTRDIHLPAGEGLDGKVVRVIAGAGYGSTIHYGERTVGIGRGQTQTFQCSGGRWFRDGELENNALAYARDAWSAVLPAEWVQPGLSLRFRRGAAVGELGAVEVGAPTQLLIHTIDLGFLTPPRDAFAFAKDPTAHREYFQTVPVSRLLISQYAPLHLTEVMLPDGQLLKDADPSKGGWHQGTMRQHIGKELISHGIDNANYGLHSTAGRGESSHPYVAAQLAAHNSRGVYANGAASRARSTAAPTRSTRPGAGTPTRTASSRTSARPAPAKGRRSRRARRSPSMAVRSASTPWPAAAPSRPSTASPSTRRTRRRSSRSSSRARRSSTRPRRQASASGIRPPRAWSPTRTASKAPPKARRRASPRRSACPW